MEGETERNPSHDPHLEEALTNQSGSMVHEPLRFTTSLPTLFEPRFTKVMGTRLPMASSLIPRRLTSKDQLSQMTPLYQRRRSDLEPTPVQVRAPETPLQRLGRTGSRNTLTPEEKSRPRNRIPATCPFRPTNSYHNVHDVGISGASTIRVAPTLLHWLTNTGPPVPESHSELYRPNQVWDATRFRDLGISTCSILNPSRPSAVQASCSNACPDVGVHVLLDLAHASNHLGVVFCL